MTKRKERATGTAIGAVCGFLTGTFALSAGLLQFLVGLDFLADSMLAITSYFVGGFFIVAVATGVYTMRPTARKLAIPMYVAAIAAFGTLYSGNLGDVSIALVAMIMASINLVGAFSLVVSDDVEVAGRTDTSDDHATDIGTGFH